MSDWRSDIGSLLRFVALGTFNTAITTAMFILLVMRLPYAAAYVVSFVVGLLINALLVARFVFRAPPSRRTDLRIAVWTLSIMLVGAGLSALCEQRGWSPLATAAAVAVVIVPTNFLGSRLVVRLSQRTGR